MEDTYIKTCGEQHLDQVLEIINEVILTSTALYDYAPRTPEMMQSWYAGKQMNKYPVIGCFDSNDVLCGFASFGPFRNWPAYKYSVEHSVYVRNEFRGKGIGKILLNAIIRQAIQQEYHTLIAGIDALNQASITLHEKAGFVLCGTIRHAGYKFGRWLDLSFYQLILETPAMPVEG